MKKNVAVWCCLVALGVCDSECEFSSPGELIAEVPGEKYDILAVDFDADGDTDVVLAWDGGVAWFENGETDWIRRDIVSGKRESISFEDGTLAIGSCEFGVEVNNTRITDECASAVEVVRGSAAYLTQDHFVYGGRSYNVSDGSDLARYREGKVLIATSKALLSFDEATSSFETLVDGVFGGRSVHASGGVAVFGSSLDDTVRLIDEEETVLVSITSRGVTSVFAADLDDDGRLDVVAACPDDETLRKYSNRGKVFSTTVIDSEARGVKAVAVADVDGDSALDVVAADDDGILYYRNIDCGDHGSSSKKKKSRRGLNITVIVVFSVVAVLAFLAAASFFCYSVPDSIKTQVQHSIRKVFSRERFNQYEDDDDDKDEDDETPTIDTRIADSTPRSPSFSNGYVYNQQSGQTPASTKPPVTFAATIAS